MQHEQLNVSHRSSGDVINSRWVICCSRSVARGPAGYRCSRKWNTHRALSRSCCFSSSSFFRLSTSTFNSMFWKRDSTKWNSNVRFKTESTDPQCTLQSEFCQTNRQGSMFSSKPPDFNNSHFSSQWSKSFSFLSDIEAVKTLQIHSMFLCSRLILQYVLLQTVYCTWHTDSGSVPHTPTLQITQTVPLKLFLQTVNPTDGWSNIILIHTKVYYNILNEKRKRNKSTCTDCWSRFEIILVTFKEN